jgi:DNA-directed RNA polymerases I and III subunit RPAC1
LSFSSIQQRVSFSVAEEHPNDRNTIVFQLKVKCERLSNASNAAATTTSPLEPHQKYTNSSIYSDSLVWIPQGDQGQLFASSPIRPVHKDILIAKLRPGQVLLYYTMPIGG